MSNTIKQPPGAESTLRKRRVQSPAVKGSIHRSAIKRAVKKVISERRTRDGWEGF